jgi:hypothetical protein
VTGNWKKESMNWRKCCNERTDPRENGKGTLFDGGDLVGPDPAGGGYPGPYIDGNFKWEIGWKYKCNSSEGEICTLDQVLTMRVSTDTNPTTVTATASKGGKEVKAIKNLP